MKNNAKSKKKTKSGTFLVLRVCLHLLVFCLCFFLCTSRLEAAHVAADVSEGFSQHKKNWEKVISILASSAPKKVFLVEVYTSGKTVVKVPFQGGRRFMEYSFVPDEWLGLSDIFFFENALQFTKHCACLLKERNFSSGVLISGNELKYRTFFSCAEGYIERFSFPLFGFELDFRSKGWNTFYEKFSHSYNLPDAKFDITAEQGLGALIFDPLCLDKPLAKASAGLLRYRTLSVPSVKTFPRTYSPFSNLLGYMKYLATRKESPVILELRTFDSEGGEYGLTAVLRPNIKILDYVVKGKSVAAEETVENFIASIKRNKFDFTGLFRGRCSIPKLEQMLKSLSLDSFLDYKFATMYYDGIMMRHFIVYFSRHRLEFLLVENPFQGLSYLKEIYVVETGPDGQISDISCISE